jgi:hypothetical protein
MTKATVISTRKEMDIDATLALKDVDFAYMAGFFDGEGSIGLYKKGNGSGYTPVLTLAQRTPTALLLFHDTFGGTLRLVTRDDRETSNRPYYELKYERYEHCACLLRKLLPFLREKREQAEIFLSFTPRHEDREHGANIVQLLHNAKRA